MSNSDSRWRRSLKRLHPEGIPWPGAVLYNVLSRTEVFRHHYELVADDVATHGPAESILDVGTGPGYLLSALRKSFPETRLVGIDVSPAMIARARKNVITSGRDAPIEVKVADANNLPFPDQAFDRVVSTGSLHHWKQPLLAMSEAYRVLKGGGYALFYDLVRRMPPAVCREVHERFGPVRLALLWIHSFEEPFLDVEEMEVLGKRTEFIFEETRFTGALCCLVLSKRAG